MATLLDVSRSGYYAWQRREQAGPTPRRAAATALIDKITTFHTDSDHVYGSPRILLIYATMLKSCSARRWRN